MVQRTFLPSWFLNMQSNCLLPWGCKVRYVLSTKRSCREKTLGLKGTAGSLLLVEHMQAQCWWLQGASAYRLPQMSPVLDLELFALWVSRIEGGSLTQLPTWSPHHGLVCFSAAGSVGRGNFRATQEQL